MTLKSMALSSLLITLSAVVISTHAHAAANCGSSFVAPSRPAELAWPAQDKTIAYTTIEKAWVADFHFDLNVQRINKDQDANWPGPLNSLHELGSSVRWSEALSKSELKIAQSEGRSILGEFANVAFGLGINQAFKLIRTESLTEARKALKKAKYFFETNDLELAKMNLEFARLALKISPKESYPTSPLETRADGRSEWPADGKPAAVGSLIVNLRVTFDQLMTVVSPTLSKSETSDLLNDKIQRMFENGVEQGRRIILDKLAETRANIETMLKDANGNQIDRSIESIDHI